MPSLEKIITDICTPNPKAFPNAHEASLVFLKNKSIFKVHLALIFLVLFTIPLYDFHSEIHFMRLVTQILMFGVFLIFCRSRPLTGRVINALLINVVGIKLCYFHPDGIHVNLIIAYGVPCFVFYLTQNISLTTFSTILQLGITVATFKDHLAEAISFSDPEEFAEKFARNFITLSIPVQTLYLFVVYNLNKKTDELSKATRIAEEALEQQKIFLYSFSHEMRNPMNSLLGNLDLALMSPEQITPEIREMVNTAKICAVLLLNLINTVLDAGKLGLGKLEFNPVATRVHDVFQRAWAISHDIMTKKGLRSHLKISKQVPPRLLLDSHRLNQILMNLVGNAIKFTEQGLIALSVEWLGVDNIADGCFMPIPYDDESEGVFEKEYNLYAMRRANNYSQEVQEESFMLSGSVKEFSLEGIRQPSIESKGVLKIIIKDTGCGMSPEELSKLFQKFSQVGQVTSKRQIGTGLGLFLSKEIIENMGGEIRVYSKLKVGTTFIICIPTTALPVQSQNQRQLNINDQVIPKLKAKKLTTIIADDSSFNVSLVCNFYSKIGVEVLETASNGKMAYEKYLEVRRRNENIDIVTLDIDMPIMNGKEVCEKIRKYERENSLKRSVIVLISGNYEEEEMHNLLSRENENKADCFLKKPLVFEEFCYELYKYC